MAVVRVLGDSLMGMELERGRKVDIPDAEGMQWTSVEVEAEMGRLATCQCGIRKGGG